MRWQTRTKLHDGDKLDSVEALVVGRRRRWWSAHRARRVACSIRPRRGDTLVSVADRFGVSLTQLRNWNSPYWN